VTPVGLPAEGKVITVGLPVGGEGTGCLAGGGEVTRVETPSGGKATWWGEVTGCLASGVSSLSVGRTPGGEVTWRGELISVEIPPAGEVTGCLAGGCGMTGTARGDDASEI
jgi:hypothetical protein